MLILKGSINYIGGLSDLNKNIVGKCLLSQILYEKRMTQTDLADITNIDRTLISKYVTRTRVMSIGTAYMIAKALKCQIEDLYEWE